MKLKRHVLYCVIAWLPTSMCSLSVNAQTAQDKKVLEQAVTEYQSGVFESAEAKLKTLLRKQSEFQPDFVLQLHNNLGNVYADLGKNVEAIDQYNQALKLAKRNQYTLDEGKINKNIGAVYMSMERLQDAESRYVAALNIGQKLKDKLLIADCHNNLGTIYEQLGKLTQAKEFYNKALSGYSSESLFGEMAMVHSNLAIVCKLSGEMDSCLYYNEMALKAAKSKGDQWMEAAISNNIGNMYGEQGNLPKALELLNYSLARAREIHALEIEILSLESISEAYAKSGNFEQAFLFQKQVEEKQEEFDGLALKKEIEALNVRYETAEKDHVAKELKIKQRNTVMIGIALVVLLLITGIYFYFFKRKQLAEKHLVALNAAMVESESSARLNLASDLHDHIGQKIAVLSMSTSRIEDEDLQLNLQRQVQQLGDEIRSVSHQLVPDAFRYGLEKSLQELKEEINASGTIRLELTMNGNITGNFSATDNLVIYRIVQEILSNSIKHAGASMLSLTLEGNANELHITLADDGKGMEVNAIRKQTGIGWKTIEARLRALNGRFSLKSGREGTTVYIEIPHH